MSAELSWVYFVSYAHSRGFGNLEISSPAPITLYSHIEQIQQEIIKLNDDLTADEVVVLTFTVLSAPKRIAC